MRVRVKGSRSVAGFMINKVFVNGRAVELPAVPQIVLDCLQVKVTSGGRVTAPMEFLHMVQATLKNGGVPDCFRATHRGGFIFVHFNL